MGKKITTKDFIIKAQEIHGNKYNYSKVQYINSSTKVEIICPKHGSFWQTPNSHLSRKGCPECNGGISLTKEKFIEKANKLHNFKYDYSKVEYINNHTKVCIICPKHGEFWQTPNAHTSRSSGCPTCGHNSTVEHKKISASRYDNFKKIYEESVFAKTLKKAEAAGRLVTLSVNYRSVKDVLRAYNIFYDNSLENQRESVQPSKALFDKTFPVLNEKDIFFVDVQYGKEAKDGFSRYNVEEIEATASILKDLIRHTENASTVSVAAIFPYAAQINRFQKANKDLINEAKQMKFWHYFKNKNLSTRIAV